MLCCNIKAIFIEEEYKQAYSMDPYSSTLEANRMIKSYVYRRVIVFSASKEESPVRKAISRSTSMSTMYCPKI